jgi:hypothetical protein
MVLSANDQTPNARAISLLKYSLSKYMDSGLDFVKYQSDFAPGGVTLTGKSKTAITAVTAAPSDADKIIAVGIGGFGNLAGDNALGTVAAPGAVGPKTKKIPVFDDKLMVSVMVGETDDNADCQRFDFEASQLSPQVAAPHSPENTKAASEYSHILPTVAYIGACTGAKLADLRAAAEVLKGRKVAAGVQLLVAPASARDQAQAAKEGVMQILIDAGASVLPNACGACAGYGGTFEEGATVISSTARNFQGRMGPASVQVYLASPATVAASALAGHIADVREVLA